MLNIPVQHHQTYYEKQIEAVTAFFEEKRKENEELDFETAFMMWLTNGYAEKFRKLYLVSASQYN